MFSESTTKPETATGFIKALGFSMAPTFPQKKGKEMQALETGLRPDQTAVARDHFLEMTKGGNPASADPKLRRLAGLATRRAAMPEEVRERLDQMALVGDPARGTTEKTGDGFTRRNKDSGPRTPEDFFMNVITETDRLQLALENLSAAEVALGLTNGLELEGPVKVKVDIGTLSRGSGADNLIRASTVNSEGETIHFNLGLDQFACPDGWDPLSLDIDAWTPDFENKKGNPADEFAKTFHKHCGNIKRDEGEDDSGFATLGILDVSGMSPAQIEKMLKIVKKIEEAKRRETKDPALAQAYNFVVFDVTAKEPVLGGQFMAFEETMDTFNIEF